MASSPITSPRSSSPPRIEAANSKGQHQRAESSGQRDGTASEGQQARPTAKKRRIVGGFVDDDTSSEEDAAPNPPPKKRMLGSPSKDGREAAVAIDEQQQQQQQQQPSDDKADSETDDASAGPGSVLDWLGDEQLPGRTYSLTTCSGRHAQIKQRKAPTATPYESWWPRGRGRERAVPAQLLRTGYPRTGRRGSGRDGPSEGGGRGRGGPALGRVGTTTTAGGGQRPQEAEAVVAVDGEIPRSQLWRSRRGRPHQPAGAAVAQEVGSHRLSPRGKGEARGCTAASAAAAAAATRTGRREAAPQDPAANGPARPGKDHARARVRAPRPDTRYWRSTPATTAAGTSSEVASEPAWPRRASRRSSTARLPSPVKAANGSNSNSNKGLHGPSVSSSTRWTAWWPGRARRARAASSKRWSTSCSWTRRTATTARK